MRFVVTNLPLNEVEVTLAYETKKKIKKIAYYGLTGVGVVILVADQIKKTNAKNTTNE